MAGYDSPLGSRRFANSQPMREFNIPQEDDQFDAQPEREMEDIAMEIAEERRMKASNKNRADDSVRNRIQFLIGSFIEKRTVKIGENDFVIRAIKSGEYKQCVSAALEENIKIKFDLEIRKNVLARSLVSIGGIELGMLLGNDDLKTRLQFIDELEENVTNKLFSEYNKMNDEIKNKYSTTYQELQDDLKK